jgi:hypothetical protein
MLYNNFLQPTYTLSCLIPHLFELLKKLFGIIHDTTMESLHNLQPFYLLRMKYSVSRDSIAYEHVALDGDILKCTESCSSVSDRYFCTGLYYYSFQPRVV